MLVFSVILFYVFLFGYAGVLTVRVNNQGFGGELFFLLPFLYLVMFFTTGILLCIALPLRLFGIRVFPIFTPKDGF